MLETNKTPVLILSIDDLQNMIEYIKEGNKKIGYSRVHKREIGCFNLRVLVKRKPTDLSVG